MATRPCALWLVPVPDFGGVARHVIDVAEHGIPGWDLAVLCPEGALADRLEATGCRVITGEFGTGHGFRASVRTLRSAIDDLSPAVVHAHLAYADIVAAVVVNYLKVATFLDGRTGAPLLATTEHGIAPEDSTYQDSRWRGPAMRLVHGVRLRVTDRKAAVCESTRRVMAAKWKAHRVEVIRNGVDVGRIRRTVEERRKTLAPKAPTFLTLSRLSEEKRLDVVVRAFAVVLKRRPDAKLVIAGRGPSEESLRSLVRGLQLEESVRFAGFLDPLDALAGADVLVQISAWENYSYTLLDAVAAGIPVVANDVGGNAEILAHDAVLRGNIGVHDLARGMDAALNRPAAAAESLSSIREMTESLAAFYAGPHHKQRSGRVKNDRSR